MWILTRSDTNQAVQPPEMARGLKGPLTLWALYAYISEDQNIGVKLRFLLKNEFHRSLMSYEEMNVKIFAKKVFLLGR